MRQLGDIFNVPFVTQIDSRGVYSRKASSIGVVPWLIIILCLLFSFACCLTSPPFNYRRPCRIRNKQPLASCDIWCIDDGPGSSFLPFKKISARFLLLRGLFGLTTVQSTHARVTLTQIALFSLRGTNCQRKVQRNWIKSTFAMINVEEFPQSPLTLPLSFSGPLYPLNRNEGKLSIMAYISHNFTLRTPRMPRQRT